MPPGSSAGPSLTTIHAGEPLPQLLRASLLLSGPVDVAEDWRARAIQYLGQAGYDGIVLVPEPRPQVEHPPSPERVAAWQADLLERVDAVLLWLPGAVGFLAGELIGRLSRSGRLVVGVQPGAGTPDAERVIGLLAGRKVPLARSLEDAVRMVLPMVLPSSPRRGGERSVPLSLWRSPSFQRWYQSLRRAGHRLEELQVEWTFRSRGVGRPPFLWAVRPRVRIAGEGREYSVEAVIGRPDVSSVVLYKPQPHKGGGRGDTLVVLVREFRAAGRGESGSVRLLPGGSAQRASERETDPTTTAVQEVLEETGLRLLPNQLEPVPLGSRQVASTLSSHVANLFRAELTAEQLVYLRDIERSKQPLGSGPSERCYLEIRSLTEAAASPDLDWGQLGMLHAALAAVQVGG